MNEIEEDYINELEDFTDNLTEDEYIPYHH